jgi:hypothetical protein
LAFVDQEDFALVESVRDHQMSDFRRGTCGGFVRLTLAIDHLRLAEDWPRSMKPFAAPMNDRCRLSARRRD